MCTGDAWKSGLVSLAFKETIIRKFKDLELAVHKQFSCHVGELQIQFWNRKEKWTTWKEEYLLGPGCDSIQGNDKSHEKSIIKYLQESEQDMSLQS